MQILRKRFCNMLPRLVDKQITFIIDSLDRLIEVVTDEENHSEKQEQP